MSYNKSYHSYFEGYVERIVTDPETGVQRIQRIYAGDYYRHSMTDQAWKKLKLGYGLRSLWTLAVFVVVGCVNVGGVGADSYVAGFTGLVCLAMVGFGYEMVCYLTAGRTLKIHQYKVRDRMKNFSMMAVLAFGALAVAELVYLGLHSWANLLPTLGLILMNVSACVVLRQIYCIESDLDYEKVPNQAFIPSDSYDIKVRSDRSGNS